MIFPKPVQRQYATDVNLRTRMEIHRRYSTNSAALPNWEFDQFAIAEGSDILEVGCGPAMLWEANADRIPASWALTLTDLSEGMVEVAIRATAGLPNQVRCQIADVQALPFADGDFDVVVANHMLYHVPDRSRAIREIRRCLSKSGTFYGMTNGLGHLQELEDLAIDCGGEVRQLPAPTFSLEGGSAELQREFSDVRVVPFDDELLVTDAEDVVHFICSIWDPESLDLERMRRVVEQRMAEDDGIFGVRKSLGLLVADC